MQGMFTTNPPDAGPYPATAPSPRAEASPRREPTPSTPGRWHVRVVAKEAVGPRIVLLSLALPTGAGFTHRPGQYVALEAADGRGRHFSIADAASRDGILTLHVGVVPGGVFTAHVQTDLAVGDRLWMDGPFGAFHIPMGGDAPALVIVGGTGLAPVLACLGAAVEAGSTRPIHLYRGVRDEAELYLADELARLSECLPSLRVVDVVERPSRSTLGLRTGFVHRAALADFPDMRAIDVFACGSPGLIEAIARDFPCEAGLDPDRFVADYFALGGITPLPPLCEEEERPLRLTVGSSLGDAAVEARAGETLLSALTRHGMPIGSVCGGNGACGTCRVRIPPAWRDRLPSIARPEQRLLAFIGAQAGDRLACRIPLTADLDGLEIGLCPREGDTHDDAGS